jgi:hypothetical protein
VRKIVREESKARFVKVIDLGTKPGEFADLFPPLMSPTQLKERASQHIFMTSQNDLVNGISQTTKKHISPL